MSGNQNNPRNRRAPYRSAVPLPARPLLLPRPATSAAAGGGGSDGRAAMGRLCCAVLCRAGPLGGGRALPSVLLPHVPPKRLPVVPRAGGYAGSTAPPQAESPQPPLPTPYSPACLRRQKGAEICGCRIALLGVGLSGDTLHLGCISRKCSRK